jgi:hypothetical protein
MATTRTLKLNLLADVSKFGSGMTAATADTNKLERGISANSKKMIKAFAAVGVAVGAMAIKIGVDAVQAAAEDELSQKKLAQALKNTTKATDTQIDSVETYISKQQLAYGIADTKLRPALANLARATGDVTKATELNNLAIDISAATGKDLETVSLALSKAYNGNLGALTKLGVPLDANILKTKDFDAATDELQKLFGGSAQANTATYAGQLAILRERFGEIQEDLGAKLLPVLKKVLDQVNLVAQGFTGDDPNKGLSNKVKTLQNELTGGDKGGAYNLGTVLRDLATAFGNLFGALSGSKATEGNDNLQNMADALQNVANAINSIAEAYRKGKSALDWFGRNVEQPFQNFLGVPESQRGITGTRALGGPVTGGNSYLVGERGPEILTMSAGRNGRIAANGSGGNTFIFNGVIDGESARRSIEKLLQDSSRRTGAINLVGATL